MFKLLTEHFLPIGKSILTALGVIFLFIESFEVISDSNVALPFWCFLTLVSFAGIAIYFLDGHFMNGFLKNRVEIKNSGVDTKIFIEFGDLFSKPVWKAIAANDFFDGIVDEDLVSSQSLHGQTIKKYWSGNLPDWQTQIDKSLTDETGSIEKRNKGNTKRYAIGTTASAMVDDQKFLFVALGRTEPSNNVTTASAENLICATRGMLTKARALCSYEPLSIPLMGSGLGRIGIKASVLADLILAGVLEETQKLKVTSTITIVLPKDKKGEINLKNYTRNWN